MKKILIIALLLPLLTCNSCKKNNQLFVIKSKIEYVVSGSASEILITYSDENSSDKIILADSAKIPWKYNFKIRPDNFVYLQAKNRTNQGFVSVKIFQNGKVLLEEENDQPFGVATCSGYVK